MKIQKIFSIVFCLSAASCFSWFSDFAKSKRSLRKEQCSESFKHFSYLKNLTTKQKLFALKAGQICAEKNIPIAVLFYEKWLKEFEGAKEKLREIEKKLAELSFYKMRDYEKAIFYYDRLLTQYPSGKDLFDLQYGLSESFFKLKKYSQGLLEVEKILKQSSLPPGNRQKALQLKGSLLMALGEYGKAIDFFKFQVERFPEKAKIFRRYLAVIFETQGRYQLAIEELKKISSPSAAEKIEALTRRLARRPKGAL